MKTIRVMLALQALLLCVASYAQPKIPVEVSHSGTDAVGGLIAYDVREAIRASYGMRLVTSQPTPTIRVNLISVIGLDSDPHNVSAVAVVIVYDSLDTPQLGALLTASVHVCGRSKAKDCARAIVANTDEAIVKLQERSPGTWKTLHRP